MHVVLSEQEQYKSVLEPTMFTRNQSVETVTEWCHSLSQDVTEQRKGNSKYADTQNEYPSDVMVRKYTIHIINAAIIIT